MSWGCGTSLEPLEQFVQRLGSVLFLYFGWVRAVKMLYDAVFSVVLGCSRWVWAGFGLEFGFVLDC